MQGLYLHHYEKNCRNLVDGFIKRCRTKNPIKTFNSQIPYPCQSIFHAKKPDAGKPIFTNIERPSNIWTRSVYYEGLMQLYAIDKQQSYYGYTLQWGEKHHWELRGGIKTRNADNQCCGQIYIDMCKLFLGRVTSSISHLLFNFNNAR